MRSKGFAVSVLAVLLLASGCSGERNVVGQNTANAPAPDPSASSTSAPAKEAGSLLASGFGQKGEAVWVTSLVHNNSGKVGQTVTVQFNALDAAGNVVRSGSPVGSFSWVGQDLVVGTQIDVPKSTKIARVEATLLIEDLGVSPSEPFPKMKTTQVKVVTGRNGNVTANFELVNPTVKPLTMPRLGILCYSAAKKIDGGGMDFPQLVPPSGNVTVAGFIITTGQPASCKVFTGGAL